MNAPAKPKNTATAKVDLVLGRTKGKPVRFSHLHVHDAQLNKQSGNMEHSVLALIPKTNTEDIDALRAAVEAIKKEEWLSNGKKLPPNWRNPLRDGDTDTKENSGDEYGPECKGHMILNCKANEDYPPEVVGNIVVEGKFNRITKREIKSGDWGRLKITLKAYNIGTSGVGAYLSSVQKTRDGDPLGSQSSAENDFHEFMDDEDGDDPMLK